MNFLLIWFLFGLLNIYIMYKFEPEEFEEITVSDLGLIFLSFIFGIFGTIFLFIYLYGEHSDKVIWRKK